MHGDEEDPEPDGEFTEDDAAKMIAELEAFLAQQPQVGRDIQITLTDDTGTTDGGIAIQRHGPDVAAASGEASITFAAFGTATAVVMPSPDAVTPISPGRARAAAKWARKILGESAEDMTKRALEGLAAGAGWTVWRQIQPVLEALIEARNKLR